MLESLQNSVREFRDLSVLPEYNIALQHGNDLIVGFVIIDQTKSADRPRLQNDIATWDVMFAQHQDVERVVIYIADLDTRFASSQIGDPLSAICSGDEAVVRRDD